MLLTVEELVACDLCHTCGAPTVGGWITPAQARAYHRHTSTFIRKLRVVGDPSGEPGRWCHDCRADYCASHWLFRLEVSDDHYFGIDAFCPWGHVAASIGPTICADERHDEPAEAAG